MKRATRAEICQAFKNAEEWLSRPGIYECTRFNGHKTYLFLCNAILEGNGDEITVGARAAIRIVIKRLDGYLCLDHWVQKQLGEFWSEGPDYNKMQAHRHAWLQLLITEFSS
jgi:hypothetical protein